jgi:hypothetical protein
VSAQLLAERFVAHCAFRTAVQPSRPSAVLKTAGATTGALSSAHLRLRQAGTYSHVVGDLRRGIAAKYVARRRGQTSAKRLPESQCDAVGALRFWRA